MRFRYRLRQFRGPACIRPAPWGPIARSAGAVTTVVTIAIRASSVKRRSSIRPASRPTVRSTISTSPRVFMSTPIAAASRGGTRIARAAPKEPRNFPAHAATRMSTNAAASPARRPGMSTAMPDVTK